MNRNMQHQNDVVSRVGQLSQAAKGIDKDDLVGMAKMHGWCEELAAAVGADAEHPNPSLFTQSGAVARALVALILGEAEDAGATLATITASVAEMASSVGPPSAEAVEPLTSSKPSDDEVAAKLAQVFDDPPPVPVALTASETGTAPAATQPPYESVPLKIGKSEVEFVKGFIPEAGEHLAAIEAAVLEVERAPNDSERINTLFRPFHTIKGAAGFLSLRDINCLTHEVETVLDQARKGERAVTPALIDLVFDVVDILKVQFAAIDAWLAEPTGDVVPQPPVAEMISHLRRVVSGAEPGSRTPGASSPPPSVGQGLVQQGACPQAVVDFAMEKQRTESPDQKVGEILVAMGAATPRQVGQALRSQSQADSGVAPAKAAVAVGDQSIRIDTAKLDALVDMVGELVIAQAQVWASPKVTTDAKLAKDVGQAAKIIRDVQQVAMAMRMVPIGPTFQKMARLVRDVSRQAGKSVDLIITGEDTELDKNVIQQISDPLVHMLRNAVDHGIESPEDRVSAGKNAVGRVHLGAFHQSGNIVIEIRDDGKGMDRQALIAKGIEKGLVEHPEELTDQQAYQLIFAPGFSLASQITDISGRGVGMDVVRRNIEQLRGRVEIATEVGKGSTFTIRLPLTLAIIDGMIVRVGAERFIFQTITVEQALRPTGDQITTIQRRGEVLNVRGRLLPLIQLGALFGVSERIDPCRAMVVIAQHDEGQVGVVVEELIGQQQVVIKSLGTSFEKLRGVSGAAILGDGKVGLILEVPGLVAAHNAPPAAYRQSAPSAPPLKITPVPSPDKRAPVTEGVRIGDPVMTPV